MLFQCVCVIFIYLVVPVALAAAYELGFQFSDLRLPALGAWSLSP